MPWYVLVLSHLFAFAIGGGAMILWIAHSVGGASGPINPTPEYPDDFHPC